MAATTNKSRADKQKRIAVVRAWLGDIHSTVEYASLEKRFWALTNLSEVEDPKTECVLWNTRGSIYPVFTIRNSAHVAHRVAVRIGLADCPPRAVQPEECIDHVKARGCSGPGCVNPYHLDIVDHTENMRRKEPKLVDPNVFT